MCSLNLRNAVFSKPVLQLLDILNRTLLYITRIDSEELEKGQL